VLRTGTESQDAKGKTSRVRVLVVEDDRVTADSLRELLEGEGFAVRAAGGYKAALKVACDWLPDVLVADICLPDRDGPEVLRCLRSAHPKMKGIAVSGCLAAEDLGRVYESGFAAFFSNLKAVTGG
jgi:CheY-like chemotaxis protein